MSSTYRILCLSHDPALVGEGEWSRPEGAEAAITAGLDEHPACDLVIGRYSCPLVEVGCPASRDQRAKLKCCHSGTIWTDRDWLHLLTAAYPSADPAVQQAVKQGSHLCWPPERLAKLRLELGITP